MPALGCKLRKDLLMGGLISKDIWLRVLLNQINSTVDKQDMFLLNKFIKLIASESCKSFWLQLLWSTAISMMSMNHLQANMNNITMRSSRVGRGIRSTLMIRFEETWFTSMAVEVERFLNLWLRSSRCKIKLTALLIRSLALFHQWVIFSRKFSRTSARFRMIWETSYLIWERLTKSSSSSSASRSHTSSIEGLSGSWTWLRISKESRRVIGRIPIILSIPK